MLKIDLNGTWNLKGISPDGESFDIDAPVPGSTLNAVLNSDIEKNLDVFYRDNAEKVQKYENYAWIYTRTFEIEKTDKNLVIVFEKLDTYCDIYINGKNLASCDNGYISHRFDITKYVKDGENEISIYFQSPITKVAGKKEVKACAFAAYERLYTRRPQCTYGWDWTMRFVTCGIGKTYIEETEEGIKIESLYIYTKSIDDESAEIVADIDFLDFEHGGVIDFEIISPRGEIVATHTRYTEEPFMRINLDVENPMLWYPLGYGEPNLYTVSVRCGQRILYKKPFGIRTVKITEITDKEGSENYNKCIELKKTEFSGFYDKNESFAGFVLKVNGEKILCKGANWVPCRPFSMGCTDERITSILSLAKDAGVNMIRVWGGGDFETEHFYDECSRLGIMVTQDFLMACARYPEDEQWFLDQLKKEAEYASELLRNKACLMWWSGDNENAVMGCDTDTDYHGRASAYKAIAPVIYKKDYNRRFLASSPYGGKFYASNTKGTTHNTQFMGSFFRYIMNSDDFSDYKEYVKTYNARFVAEEPILGASSEKCLKNFMTHEDIYGDDLSMWLYHTKGNPGLEHEIFEYIYEFARGIMGDFKDSEDRFFKLKYLQYEWVRLSMERTRREKWFSSGVIYWMLNDCWPAASGWALIDYYNEPKPAYYSFKRGAKPVVVSVDFEDGKYKIHICNDGKEQTVPLKWYAISKDGKIAAQSGVKEIAVPKNTSLVALELDEDEIPKDCFIVAETDCDRAFYRKGILDIVPSDERIAHVKVEGEYVKVTSNAYIHALEFCSDCVFEDNYFSLLPGEERSVKIIKKCDENVSAKAYTI